MFYVLCRIGAQLSLPGSFHRLAPPYRPQIQGQLWVSEREWCDFISFDPRVNGVSGYFKVREYRDDKYILELEKKVFEFVEDLGDLLIKIK